MIHLPRRLLNGKAQKRTKKPCKRPRVQARGKDEDSDSEEELEPEMAGGWTKRDPGLVGTKIPHLEKPVLPDEIVAAAGEYSAYDYYKLFQPDSFADLVVEQSRVYGGQQGILKKHSDLDADIYRLVNILG